METRRKTTLLCKLSIAVVASGVALIFSPTAEAGPEITTPELDAKIGAGAYYIQWRLEDDAESYLLRIREKDASTFWVNRTLWTTSFAFRPLAYEARGKRFEVFVYSCANPKGTGCGETTTVSAYVLGAPVTLIEPSDGALDDNLERRPTFMWEDYEGLYPSSGGGTLTYTITFSGNGASDQTFTTESSSFTPPEAINPAFQNPVRWSLTVCNTNNCSSESEVRKITLEGSTFDQQESADESDSPE